MATHHAKPGEVVNLATWADDLPEEHSKVIARTDEMELARLVLKEGDNVEKLENQHEEGPLIVHCLSGGLDVTALGLTRQLSGGELLYLPPTQAFSLKARKEALVLIIFIFAAGNKAG